MPEIPANLLIPKRASVAQLDRASGFEPEGRRFESCRTYHSLDLCPAHARLLPPDERRFAVSRHRPL